MDYIQLGQFASSFKFFYFHIKHKEQELGRKEGGGVKTHEVKMCLVIHT